MSCESELTRLRRSSPDPDDDAKKQYANNPLYRLGYAAGFRDAMGEAIDVVREHEERE
jgi:hypothetical protein